ncbi:MAG TPA: ATP-binding protein [Polyangiaceae bacterium]|nr:ATP-binding protein [Polyangiaceae bacterium]
MTTGRLTRQELGWLLAQEARGAAKILRQDVTLLSQPPPPDANMPVVPDIRVHSTLNALDDAIDMLTELETGPQGSKPASRRGRIDLAALLWEFAPTASISIEPGAGTEVFGEESELRRMLNVLLSQTNFAGGPQHEGNAAVRIRRESDWIRITANLGPDVSASTELERRWLSRMATRMGGRLDLEGGTMALLLPADASVDQSEVADLRKELVQAQQLGEAYARELATAFAAGQMPEPDVQADRADVAVRRFALLVALSAAVHRTLSTVFRGLEEELERLAPSNSRTAVAAHVSSGHALVAVVGRVASCPTSEPTQLIDVAKVLRDAAADAEARAARHGVHLVVEAPHELAISTRPRAFALLTRTLLDHAISASPRGTKVDISVTRDGSGARIMVSDGGPVVPAAARADLLEHQVDPTSLGRPPGPALLIAQVVTTYLGGALKLGESPTSGALVEAFVPASG